MPITIIIECLKCGEEFAQSKQAINSRINEGLTCPYCKYVHFATDFIEAYLVNRPVGTMTESEKSKFAKSKHRRIVL